MGIKRRSHVGMDITFWNAGELGDVKLDRDQLFEMLRRSKQCLAMRSPSDEIVKRLERRRD